MVFQDILRNLSPVVHIPRHPTASDRQHHFRTPNGASAGQGSFTLELSTLPPVSIPFLAFGVLAFFGLVWLAEKYSILAAGAAVVLAAAVADFLF